MAFSGMPSRIGGAALKMVRQPELTRASATQVLGAIENIHESIFSPEEGLTMAPRQVTQLKGTGDSVVLRTNRIAHVLQPKLEITRLARSRISTTAASTTAAGDRTNLHSRNFSILDAAAMYPPTGRKVGISSEIERKLDKDGIAFIYGAPGSGKTEQTVIACGSPPKEFDLRQEYFESCFSREKEKQENRIGRPLSETETAELNDKFWDSWSGEYLSSKEDEAEWIDQNYDRIANELISSPEDTIVLDEIDLDGAGGLSASGERTALRLMDLARDLKSAGKKVVVVLHKAGLESEALTRNMVEQELCRSPNEVIKTRPFSADEQLELLKEIGVPFTLAMTLDSYTEGIAPAYLPILKAKQKGVPFTGGYYELIKQGQAQIQKNINVLRKTASSEANEVFSQLSTKGSLSVKENGISEEVVNELLDSQLVVLKEGKLVLPEIVKDVLTREKAEMQLIMAPKTKNPKAKPAPLEERLERLDPFSRASVEFCLENIGKCRLLESEGRSPFVVPEDVSMLNQSFFFSRHTIAEQIGVTARGLKEERTHLDHLEWSNGATSTQGLLEIAEVVKPFFLDVVRSTCDETGTEYYAGENDEFVLKSEDSIDRKVSLWASSSGAPIERMLQGLNDTVRSTVIADSPESLGAAAKTFETRAQELGWDVVFSDKFKEDYSTGYVGVHAKVKMRDPSTGKEIMGEVQFHLRDIHDGTMHSVKERSHKVMEDYQRALSTPTPLEEAMGIVDDWGLDEVPNPVDTVIQSAVVGQKVLFTGAMHAYAERA